jgi:hypothetical protein
MSVKEICISQSTSLEGLKETNHAALSCKHNIQMFLRYIADTGFPTGIQKLGGYQSTALITMLAII